MISLEKKFIFMHIPRTAGTSIERSVLEPYAHYFEKDRENALIEANFSDTLDQNTEYDQGGDFFGKHFSIRDYYAVLTNSEDFDTYFDRDSLVNINSNPLDHFYKFTVVRNPWDRFVSYYLDYVEDQNEENFKDMDGNWFKRGYDQALYLPLLFLSIKRKYIDEVCYYYRINSNSMLHREWKEKDQLNTVKIVRSRGFIA